MDNFDGLTVCLSDGGDEERAGLLADRLRLPLSHTAGNELTVVFDSRGASLSGYGMTFRNDFEQTLRRISGGHLQHEMLARVAKTKVQSPCAVDAAAGMGEDALLLAACGYDVTMFERNPVIAVLLSDAMKRAEKHPELGSIVSRMHLTEGDSTLLMRELDFTPDAVYLDPMFPQRQKSGLVNKKLQLIQKLEQPCVEEEAMLDSAIMTGAKKIIIKRPLKGSYLAGRKPDYSIKGKAIRFDVFSY